MSEPDAAVRVSMELVPLLGSLAAFLAQVLAALTWWVWRLDRRLVALAAVLHAQGLIERQPE